VARAVGPVVLRIDFGAGGNARQYQRHGFSAPEATHTWSVGPLCDLVVPGFGSSQTGENLWLEIRGIGFIAAPHLVSRVLGIAVNGVALAEFDIEEATHVHAFVPGHLLANTADLVIEFRHPICPSPQSMGLSDDARPLGFWFEFVALRRLAG
jgi:hypothetical protein